MFNCWAVLHGAKDVSASLTALPVRENWVGTRIWGNNQDNLSRLPKGCPLLYGVLLNNKSRGFGQWRAVADRDWLGFGQGMASNFMVCDLFFIHIFAIFTSFSNQLNYLLHTQVLPFSHSLLHPVREQWTSRCAVPSCQV